MLLGGISMKSNDNFIYRMQVIDKACTICVHVFKGGKICKECISGENKPLWQNAYMETPELKQGGKNGRIIISKMA